MPLAKLRGYLDEHNVKYAVISHSEAFTAQEVAAVTHIPGVELAKTVMVKLDGDMAMAVVPAPYRVNLDRLAEVAGAERCELATEEEFGQLFPDSEVGAMPPFGNLWSLSVYVADRLAEDLQIAFAAGSHSEVVQLAFEDFRRLVEPTIVPISQHP
jgi:Ala-tRNA(Pro) deacylase